MKNNIRCEGKQNFNKELAHYVYVLVRTDLPISQQVVQAIHSSMIATQSHGRVTEDTRLALLSVKNEEHLLEIEEKCKINNISYEKFWEPDNMIGWSALTTEPIKRNQGKVFKSLSLWNPENRLMCA